MGYVWDTNESCAYGAEPNSARVRAHAHGGSHSSRYLARPVGTARMVQQARYGRSTGLSASGCSWLQCLHRAACVSVVPDGIGRVAQPVSRQTFASGTLTSNFFPIRTIRRRCSRWRAKSRADFRMRVMVVM
ncbi:hypothetical protein BVI2075_350051 [Burkholderia vietnamiensis]|nr:hypothetical protein BVI2075_350051 [Burkholderia vietnamiensis]